MKVSALTAMFFALVVGFPIASMAGLAADGDNDGIPDAMDNCSTVSNAANFCDDDTDGYGNACTSDAEPDGDTDINDFLNGFYPAFQASTSGGGVSSRYNGDCGGDTDINDFLNYWYPRFQSSTTGPLLGNGPSGLGCAGTVPCS